MPALAQHTHLRFPSGGLVRRVGFQSQHPYTTPAANNVRPDDVAQGRERGGQRPGLAKAYAQQLGAFSSSTVTVSGGTTVTLAAGTWPDMAAYGVININSVGDVGVSSRDSATQITLQSAVANGAGLSYVLALPVQLLTDVSYVVSSVLRTRLVAVVNGRFYWDVNGTMTEIVTTLIADDQMLTATDHLQRLYIAGNTNIVVFDPTAGGGAGAIANIVASAGTAPTTCTMICTWRDRLVAAGDLAAPHVWYMSKQGDGTNWDYTGTGVDSAVAATTADAGRLGEPIRALIPHSDACLIFGCSSSLWILRGDPFLGGIITRLSSEVGVMGPNAWCYDPEGYLWFLSTDGLYAMAPGCGSTPGSISREKLPEELVGLQRAHYQFSMAYDIRARGIHFMCSRIGTTASLHYFIDTKTTTFGDRSPGASFWPQSFVHAQDSFQALARRDHVPTSSTLSPVMLGGRDGYIRQFNQSLTQDDTTNTIASYVDFGPIALARLGDVGRLDEVIAVPATGSGAMDMTVRVGDTAMEAYGASAFSTTSYTSNGVLTATVRPMARGGAAVIRIANGSTTGWILEELLVRVSAAGRRRIL